LYTEAFLAWVEDRSEVGMVITAGIGSDPELVGFASQELKDYSQIPLIGVGESIAPTIVVDFVDGSLPNLLIAPANDSSTFHQVAALPEDQVQVQSGLQSYSVLAYDIPPIPEGSCVTGLGLRMSPVSTSTIWNGDCLLMSYIDSTRIDWSGGFIESVPYWGSSWIIPVCPEADGTPEFLGFGPETGYVGPLPKVMHFLSFFDELDYKYLRGLAEIYFSQSTFQGPGAAPELRPALMIITGKKED